MWRTASSLVSASFLLKRARFSRWRKLSMYCSTASSFGSPPTSGNLLRSLEGMSVLPNLVSKKGAQGRRDLPALIPFRPGRHGARGAKHVAPQCHKIRHGVAGVGPDALRCRHDAAPLNQQECRLDRRPFRCCAVLLRFARFLGSAPPTRENCKIKRDH